MSERETMRFKAAIRAVALEDGIPAQVVLQNYMLERLLARIVKTPVRDNLVVKGGLSETSRVAQRLSLSPSSNLPNRRGIYEKSAGAFIPAPRMRLPYAS